MYIYIKKVLNNGYGDTVNGFTEVQIDELTLKRIWISKELQSTKEELMEKTNFDWNVFSKEEGEQLFQLLQKDGIVSDEFEECICCIGTNREQILETLLKMI